MSHAGNMRKVVNRKKAREIDQLLHKLFEISLTIEFNF